MDYRNISLQMLVPSKLFSVHPDSSYWVSPDKCWDGILKEARIASSQYHTYSPCATIYAVSIAETDPVTIQLLELLTQFMGLLGRTVVYKRAKCNRNVFLENHLVLFFALYLKFASREEHFNPSQYHVRRDLVYEF
jgi:hypothetical protein